MYRAIFSTSALYFQETTNCTHKPNLADKFKVIKERVANSISITKVETKTPENTRTLSLGSSKKISK
jgi:hypothetical protein